jgi:S-DNA-T family DNA segregation ATPase FtsK/SpoIIIE
LGGSGSSSTPRSPGSPIGGGSSTPPAGGGSGGGKPPEKKDDPKPGESGVNKLLGRFAPKLGGEKKDDGANKPASPAGGANKPAGGGLPSKPGEALAGLSGKVGGLVSGLRGGGEKKDDGANKPAAPAGASKPPAAKPGESGGGIGGKFGGFVSGLRGGGEAKPPASGTAAPPPKPASPAPSSSAPASSAPKTSPFGAKLSGGGGAPAAAPAKPAAPKVNTQAIADRLKGLNPFGKSGGKKPAKAAKPPRNGKAVEVKPMSLSLDKRLEIAGIVMVLGALVLLLSSLSPTRGTLTFTITNGLSQTFGAPGAVVFVMAMLPIGIWLIMLRAGDETPAIDMTRIAGAVLLFLCAITLLHFLESMNYKIGPGQDYIETVREIFVPVSAEFGRGGGRIGGALYVLLISNFTEIGGLLIALCATVIGLMLVTSMSISQLIMILIGTGRGFADAIQRRRQRRAAAMAELAEKKAQQAALAASSQPAAAKPEALPAAAKSPALPAPAASAPVPVAMPLPEAETEERSIPITMGGRTVTAAFRPVGAPEGEQPAAMPVPRPPQSPIPAAAPATPAAPAEKKDDAKPSPAGILGGIGSRLRPGSKEAKPDAAKPGQEKKEEGGGLLGRLPGIGGRLGSKEAAPAKPDAAQPASPPVAPSAPQQPSAAAEVQAAPAASVVSGAAPAAAAADEAKAPTPSEASPFQRPPLNTAARKTILEDDDEDDELEDDEPARLDNVAAKPEPSHPQPFQRPPLSDAPPAKPEEGSDSVKKTGERPAASLARSASDEEELANLPPAQPKGTGPLPRQTQTAARVMPPRIPDLQTRMNALRSGSVAVDAASDGEKAATPNGVGAPVGASASKTEPTDSNLLPPFDPPYTRQPAARPAAPAAVAAPNGAATPQPEKEAPTLGLTQQDLPALGASLPTARAGLPPAPAPPLREARPSGVVTSPAPPPPPARNAGLPESTPAAPAAAPVPPPPPRRAKKEWRLPDSGALLTLGTDQELSHDQLLGKARMIEETLSSFGAPGRVVEVRTGPVITQFGVEPDYLSRGGKKNRVKVSAIAALDKDLQLALGAKSIRIEAPVPGKGYVGIEVPNDKSTIVRLRDVLESPNFSKIKSPLAIALGQSVDGTPVAADLASMPHLLIAGTTGSGKSVCVNTIIASLLIKNSPERLRFIMVDPKRVELTGYNGIPHLAAPVVVELERTIGVLKWVTREMDERYRRFANAGARNIDDFNRHLAAGEEQLPYIVVIIDELADLMLNAPDDTERHITRIAALARATGIHLIIATQRPSVDVVTGLIKANFPARIAFAVASGTDSRVILDQPGADRLLGRGDMLYMSGDSPAPQRLQGVFVSDSEISNITHFWRSQLTDEDLTVRPMVSAFALDEGSSKKENGRGGMRGGSPARQQEAYWDRDDEDDEDEEDIDLDDNGDDDLYEQAVDLVRRLNKASVSLLQRRLRIGYTRAARLIDVMEERGVVGPPVEGSKPRDVLPPKL